MECNCHGRVKRLSISGRVGVRKEKGKTGDASVQRNLSPMMTETKEEVAVLCGRMPLACFARTTNSWFRVAFGFSPAIVNDFTGSAYIPVSGHPRLDRGFSQHPRITHQTETPLKPAWRPRHAAGHYPVAPNGDIRTSRATAGKKRVTDAWVWRDRPQLRNGRWPRYSRPAYRRFGRKPLCPKPGLHATQGARRCSRFAGRASLETGGCS